MMYGKSFNSNTIASTERINTVLLCTSLPPCGEINYCTYFLKLCSSYSHIEINAFYYKI